LSGTGVFFSVSDILTAPGRTDEYLAYRRDTVNPPMTAMPGFLVSILARDRADPRHFTLINSWRDEAASDAYRRTPIHDLLRDKIRGELTERMDMRRYAPVDLPNGGGLSRYPERPEYVTISTHTVHPGRTEEYLALRRSAVNPGMAGLDGFISTSLLRYLDGPDEFLVVNQWTSRQAAEAYSTSRLHDGFRERVRAQLANHSGTREYDTVRL
jgi:quinol monooxygenase YgiN